MEAPKFRTMSVLTHADCTELRKSTDLKGKRVAGVSSDAFAGYLVAAREMLDAGFDPETDFGERRFFGLPMFRTCLHCRTDGPQRTDMYR
ncbi:PhnD/SsuA/transferrin family substrate-binding protein [Duganella sp. P38]|uniref:PhnD/SsuA/transferrin family substrate-binding protein n=1 Tax=Duganella sp. P38 TaxID=3423949 RepID=UPI003D7A43D2